MKAPQRQHPEAYRAPGRYDRDSERAWIARRYHNRVRRELIRRLCDSRRLASLGLPNLAIEHAHNLCAYSSGRLSVADLRSLGYGV
jgi:hypothetical protein